MSVHVESLGRGRDLVLLHGWGLHGGAWSEAAALLARRFRVHVMDLPGHGRSAAFLPATFDDAVAAVAARVPAGAAVCGWSLGGLFAQRLARIPGARPSALVLVSTTPCFVQRDGWDCAMKPATLESFSSGLARDRAGTLRNFVQLNALHGSHGREAVRAFAARLADHGEVPAAALATSLGWLAAVDLRAAAAAIDVPTLVVHGARDALAPVAAGRWLAAQVPGARLLEIADAAHLPFFTHREAFVSAVESFLG